MKRTPSAHRKIAKSPFDVRFQDFVNATLAFLGAKEDINEAFAVSEWLATYLWENASGIYRLDQLEETLVAKLELKLNDCMMTSIPLPGELHVATELYRSGGHTPLAANLIRSSHSAVDVLLTRMEDVQLAADLLQVPNDRIRSAGTVGDMPLRVKALVEVMLQYDRVILHIHPNDVACAVAVRFAKRLRPAIQVCFINHADHVFSVGIGAADRVFEVSAYASSLRADRRTEAISSFIGLPIERPQRERHNRLGLLQGPVTQLVTRPDRPVWS